MHALYKKLTGSKFRESYIVKLFQKVSFLALSHVISGLLVLATTPVLASKLKPELYGEFSFMESILFVSILIASMGTEYIGNREVARQKRSAEIVNGILILRMAVSLLIYILLVSWIFLFVDSENVKVLMLICATIVLSVPGIAGWYFLAQHKIRVVAITTVCRDLLFFVFIVFFLGDPGINENMLIQAGIFFTLSRLFFAAVLFIKLLKIHKFSLHVTYSTYYKIIKDSSPLLYATIIVSLSMNMETFLLKYFDEIYSLGIYGAFFKQVFYLQLMTISFVVIFFPLLSKAWTENIQKYEKLANILSEVIIFMMLPVAIIGVLNADYFIKTLFSAEYEQGVLTLQVLCLCLIPMGLQRVLCTGILVSMDKSSRMIALANIAFIFNITVGFLLIGNMQRPDVGAALTKLFTEILSLIIAYYIVSKSIKVIDFRMFYCLFPALVLMILMHFVFPWENAIMRMLSCLLTFTLIYIFIMYKKRYQTIKEISMMQE